MPARPLELCGDGPLQMTALTVRREGGALISVLIRVSRPGGSAAGAVAVAVTD